MHSHLRKEVFHSDSHRENYDQPTETFFRLLVGPDPNTFSARMHVDEIPPKTAFAPCLPYRHAENLPALRTLLP